MSGVESRLCDAQPSCGERSQGQGSDLAFGCPLIFWVAMQVGAGMGKRDDQPLQHLVNLLQQGVELRRLPSPCSLPVFFGGWGI
eukprot:2212849-Amphidinium_carterae.4